MCAIHRIWQVTYVTIAVRDCLCLTALLVPHHKVTRSPEGKCRKTSALCPTCLEVAVEADTILTVLVFVHNIVMKLVPSTSFTRAVIALRWSHITVLGGEPPLTL